MTEFFAPTIQTEKTAFDKLRVHMVDGDTMEPELKSRRDYVLVAPVADYCGEGIYLVDNGLGAVLCRCAALPGKERMIRVSYDNPVYRHGPNGGHYWSSQEFSECVLAIVVADVKVRDSRFLKAA
ncbi:S24/S26 family peptidase [Rhizobium sp. NXC24]|uniref:S24/S26 family peptidase n=1 Tax=Rhizobium sp. NXC24 TaxID=2048897 RepID=UPI000CDF42C7|nr:S24/S26 family peptidase [Rhizobium sp. NXC24]AVA22451.1 hypothetical protein NXC24_CH02821 [Rhizobium sp. NXC24]